MKTPALFLLEEGHWEEVYGPLERKRLEAHIQTPFIFHSEKSIFEKPGDLEDATVIFSGWGMPLCNESFLEAAPRLQAIFFAAGSVRNFVTDAFWERGIVVSSANSALAVTVAEFALAEILLSLKLTWRQSTDTRAMKRHIRHTVPGIYGSVVGLISVGTVARHLISLLRSFRLDIVAYDPFLSRDAARSLGIKLVSLEELFEISHVVSLHTPWLPETEGMIRGHHLARMRKNGTFINTARGAVVNEKEMIEVLRRRPDLYALLDVTYPDPPLPESPLYVLPNVILTPHIAGPINGECRRLGAMAVDEFERYSKGEPLLGKVREEMLATIA
jgi:phosphoglycerate dehydrogenase-like enzyme